MTHRIAVAVLLATAAACASAPPRLIALPPAPAPLSAELIVQRPGPTLLLRRLRVPGYLDGFPIVLGRTDNALIVSDDAEWAERLSDGASRVLRDALSRRLGPSRVLIEGDGRIPDAELTIELVALDPQASGYLDLDARWSFLGSASGLEHAGRIRLQVPLGMPTPSAVAAATAEALGQLADVLALEAQHARQR